MGAGAIQALFVVFLEFTKTLMRVHTAVFTIFAMFFEFTGNIQSNCWWPVMFKFEDFKF